MNDFTQQRFSTPDGLLLTADTGGQPVNGTVVLLHGGGQTRHSWSGAMRRLMADGYHVVNYDSRGHGESDWDPKGEYSLPVLASDLKAVLSTLHGPLAVVGASMGGMAGLYAIGTTKERIADALVMVDIVLRPSAEGAEKIRAFMSGNRDGFATLEEAADAVSAYNPSRPRPSDPSGLRKNLRLRADGRLHWHWDPRMLDQSPTAEPPSYAASMVEAARHVLIPTLLVRGAKSDIVDDEGVAEMRALMPQTEVHEVPGAGHMVAGDRNDAFNDGVIAFLRRHLRS